MPQMSVTKTDLGFVVGVDAPEGTKFTLERVQVEELVRPVRGAENLVSPGTPLFISDYTMLQNTLTSYRLRIHDTDGDVVTEWLDTEDYVDFGGDVLFAAHNPRRRMPITVESFPEQSHDIEQEIVKVLGRADPVVVSNRRQYPNGTMTLLTFTDSERRALMELINAAPIIGLSPYQSYYGFDSMPYFSIGRLSEMRPSPRVYEPTRRWMLEVQRVEPARPERPISTPIDPTDPDLPQGENVWDDWIASRWVNLAVIDWRRVAGA